MQAIQNFTYHCIVLYCAAIAIAIAIALYYINTMFILSSTIEKKIWMAYRMDLNGME